MTTIAKDDTSDEELYYSVRGNHRTVLLSFNKPDEKAQVLEALRAAAEKTDIAAVRNGYLDLADDLEENRKILYSSLPGEFWGEDGYIFRGSHGSSERRVRRDRRFRCRQPVLDY